LIVGEGYNSSADAIPWITYRRSEMSKSQQWYFTSTRMNWYSTSTIHVPQATQDSNCSS
jgi:hypothetical protein